MLIFPTTLLIYLTRSGELESEFTPSDPDSRSKKLSDIASKMIAHPTASSVRQHRSVAYNRLRLSILVTRSTHCLDLIYP